MAFSFGGEFRVGKKREEVHDFLVDPRRFGPLLPDFESVEMRDDRHGTVKLKVGISHIRGTAKFQLELAESERPKRATYQGKGSVAGGTVNFTAGFELAEDGGGTRILWKGEAQIFGRLVAMAGGLLEPLTQKNIQRVIDALQRALS